MKELCLNRQQLKSLTGCYRNDKIAQALAAMHIPFIPDMDGFPRVSYELVQRKLGNVESVNGKIRNINLGALGQLNGQKKKTK